VVFQGHPAFNERLEEISIEESSPVMWSITGDDIGQGFE
jgi:hypothetical protein